MNLPLLFVFLVRVRFDPWLQFDVLVGVVHLGQDALARLCCHAGTWGRLTEFACLRTVVAFGLIARKDVRGVTCVDYWLPVLGFFVSDIGELRGPVIPTVHFLETLHVLRLILLIGVVSLHHILEDTTGSGRQLIMFFVSQKLYTLVIYNVTWLPLVLPLFLSSILTNLIAFSHILKIKSVLLGSFWSLSLHDYFSLGALFSYHFLAFSFTVFSFTQDVGLIKLLVALILAHSLVWFLICIAWSHCGVRIAFEQCRLDPRVRHGLACRKATYGVYLDTLHYEVKELSVFTGYSFSDGAWVWDT